jgi:hypothetical protein
LDYEQKAANQQSRYASPPGLAQSLLASGANLATASASQPEPLRRALTPPLIPPF